MRKILSLILFSMLIILVGCHEDVTKDFTEEELKIYNEFQEIKKDLDNEIPEIITSDIRIRMLINGYGIDWETSNPEVLPLTGRVNRIDEDVEVTLTAKLSYYDFAGEFKKTVIVQKKGFKDMENRKLVFAYLYDHKVNRIEDYDQLDVINYSFAIIKDGKLSVEQRPNISAFVRDSHNHGVKVVLALGGWGAGGFSEAAMTKESRKILVDSIVDAVKEYNLDGIDFDWEYPTTGVAGIGFDPKDLGNFTSLVKETREALDNYKEGLILSSAFAGGTWAINIYYQVKELNKYLDYFHIMTYDTESRSIASHHSALYNSVGASSSVDSSIKGYIAAGASPSKIVVGGAFYGKFANIETNSNPLGKSANWPGRSMNYSMIKSIYLDNNPQFIFFDEVAKAPYYYDGKNFITYDDERSLKEKSNYIHENELAGMMFWQLTGDDTGTLLNAIYENLVNEKND